ncbi:MAG: dihydroorotase [Desulfobacteraceae bacterium]|jgi:dihydroorotase|nr:dihydroorotase [Desulfobacteraceae bacterium]
MQIRIAGGRIIDPGHFDGTADIVVEDGKISRIVEHSEHIAPDHASNAQHPESRIIDASGKIVTPGLIDMHVHLREPGHEYKETIESGCRAAAWGGFSAVCCMPNTNPVNDSPQVTEYIRTRAEQLKLVRVFPVAAISRGIEGKTRCDFEALKQAGAVAVSDDGNPVMNSRMMRRAMEAARDIGLKVISHCEDISLAADGAMHEGAVAQSLGYPGIPGASESIMVMRDIALGELTRAPVHIAHVSAAESVRAIRDAKARGIRVTAETAPHYFTITEKAVNESGTHAKMNPPLRTETDREAICEGLADGTIDVIATDHAPHSSKEKDVDFGSAANGIIGLETSVSLSLKLVQDGVLSLSRLVEKMSTNPARILGLESGLRVGRTADITIIDPDVEYTVNSNNFQSLSRNTPFEGWRLKGRAIFTLVGGRVVYEFGKI